MDKIFWIAALSLGLSLPVAAFNRVGDANNNQLVNMADAALVQSRLYGQISASWVSPLALADNDSQLDLGDMLFISQIAKGVRFSVQPRAGLLTITPPASTTFASGTTPNPLLVFTVASNYPAATLVDGLHLLGWSISPSVPSTLANSMSVVAASAASAELVAFNPFPGDDIFNVSLSIPIHTSSTSLAQTASASRSYTVTPSVFCSGKLDGTVCVAAAGPCEFDDLCVGGICVDQGFKNSSTMCQPQNPGQPTCDPADYCTGSSASCPTTYAWNGSYCAGAAIDCRLPSICQNGLCVGQFRPYGYVCSPAWGGGGLCAELICNGTSPTCGTPWPAGTPCGSFATGPCDAANTCDGLATINSCIDRVQLAGTTCQAAGGVCNPADTCDGSTKTCAANYAPAGTACGGSAAGCDDLDTCNGAGACTDRVDPAGALCLAGTGVCDPDDTCNGSTKSCAANFAPLNAPCGGSSTGCDALDTCNASGSCVDRFDPANSVCEAGTGVCDPDDLCDGATTVCPVTLAASGTACGGSDAVCDALDVCDGTGVCEDLVDMAGTVCRADVDGPAPTGACDAQETCDGTLKSCPADTIEPDGTMCLDVLTCTSGACGLCGNGALDAGEQCDLGAGTNGYPGICCAASCQFATADTLCRAAAGVCDAAELCTGTSDFCPADGFQPTGFACGDADASACNAPDSCDGAGACVDRKDTAGTVCLTGNGSCDPDDLCDGTGNACATILTPSGTACGDADASACNAPDSCDGVGACLDHVDAAGSLCQAAGANATCDPADTCNGSSKACAANLAPNGTGCGGASAACDALDTCDGAGACVDLVDPSGFICQAAGASATCNPADTCDGSSKTCAVILTPSGTACGGVLLDLCDFPDNCNGLGACVDLIAPSGYVCRPEGVMPCNPQDICNGITKDCYTVYAQPGLQCSAAVLGECDALNVCSGPNCVDALKAPGTPCGPGGPCNYPATCNGGSYDCPLPSSFPPAGTACGGSSAACDALDTCNGSGSCIDLIDPAGFVCLAGSGICNPDDTCDGATKSCTTLTAPNGTVCASAAGICDQADTCAGGTCADNGFQPASTVCGADSDGPAPNGGCDASELCTGASASCPVDALEADGISCDDGINEPDLDTCVSGVCTAP